MQRFNHVFGMRHHADDVSGFVANAGDVVHRAIGIAAFDIAEHHAALAFKALDGFGVGDVIAFTMGHRAGDHRALIQFVGEKGSGVLHLEAHFAADKFKARIAHQGTR